MAYTTPRAWKTGEVATAALLNTHLSDNMTYLKGEADRLDTQTTAAGSGTSGTNSSGKNQIVIGRVTDQSGGSGSYDWYHESKGSVGGVTVSQFNMRTRDGDSMTMCHTLLVPNGSTWAFTGDSVSVTVQTI